MASDYTGFAAKLENEGVILVRDELSMMRLAALYDTYGDAPAKGGIALVSPSGGAIAQTTDRISEKGLKLAVFGPETHRRLETLYVPGLTDNPLDFANMHDNSFVDVGDGGAAILADDEDVAAIIGVFGTAHNLDEMVSGIGPAVAGKKPVLFTVLPASNGDRAREVAAELGFMALDSIEETLEVLHLWFAGRPHVHGPSPRPSGLPRVTLERGDQPVMLGEFEAKQLLAGYGIPVTREKKAVTLDEAVSAASEIGFPVVLKGFGAKLVHKSEFGAVKLNLADTAAVREAWGEMASRIGPDLEGCVVGQMVKGQVEVICGAFHNEDFGPMVMFGAGGVLAELLHDVAVLPAPAHPDAIREKLLGLKCAKLLTGFRGKPPADIDALVDAIHRLSHFVAEHAAAITELDINPVIVAEAGKGAVAVDARIGLAAEA
jgi:acetyl-CoA synthetase (ADP-forming)